MRISGFLALAALALAGCSRMADPAPQQTATSVLDRSPSAADLAAASAAAGLSDEGDLGGDPGAGATAPALPASAGPPPSFTQRDPAKVLAAWAAAVTARDWGTVRAFWGDAGARSGLPERAFARQWGTLVAPQVSVGPGDQEGAAGSIYYTAPVTITDGKRRIDGEVVLRRVNDVDGASPEQLRWHIESSTLKP